jgi:putative addiction module component (TIGR02574 family)
MDMEAHAENVLQIALGLTPTDRAEIATALISSLDAGGIVDANDAWAAEIRGRIDSIDKGQVQLVPWDDVIGSMRDRLNDQATN